MSKLSELLDEVLRIKAIKGDGRLPQELDFRDASDQDFRDILSQACLVIKRRRVRRDHAFLREMEDVLKRPLPRFMRGLKK